MQEEQKCSSCFLFESEVAEGGKEVDNWYKK